MNKYVADLNGDTVFTFEMILFRKTYWKITQCQELDKLKRRGGDNN